MADPSQGVLWARMGDQYGGLLRSVDDGVTWRPVVDGPIGVAVDGVPGGGYVLGTTRETSGDVYAPGDVSAHVLSSADGVHWQQFRDFPRLREDDYVRADVYWQLPSGELVLELLNSQELGPAGFLLLKAVRK